MTKRAFIIGGIVIGIPALVIAWWLFSPLLFDEEVNEEFPMSAEAVVPDDMTQEEVEAEMEKAAEEPDAEAVEEMPEPEPVALATGLFRGADSFHEGSGKTTIYQLEDGSRVLRLENFSVTNGPDLHVILVPDGDPIDSGDVSGYIDLGELKGNVGDQNYDIPADVDVADYGSVVIYCEPFHVIFSVASTG